MTSDVHDVHDVHDVRDALDARDRAGAAPVAGIPTLGVDVGDAAATSSNWRPGRRQIGLYLTVGWLVFVILAAVFADLLPLQDPMRADPRNAARGPGVDHWFGTDTLGRDILARCAFGGRVTLFVAFTSVAVAGTLGSLLGFVSGYYRGRIESVIVSALDALLAFPTLVLALALTAFLGPGQRNVIIAVTIVATPVFGRLVRAQTLTFSEREFVTAARASGASNVRILFTEVAPNVAPSIVAFALVLSALAIAVEASLSFLGLGVPPPTATWGSMIAMGRGELEDAAHIVLIPTAAMFVTVLALNVLGDRLRTYFDVMGGNR